ncbi:MAG TPA: hypothetical protein VNA11_02415 [Pseudonocardia sp.]|jgi:hypothetical protein|nr:hypothetical protein [Pseudonocardia sp.]
MTAADSDRKDDVLEGAQKAFLSAWTPLAAIIADTAMALRARRRSGHTATEGAHERPVQRRPEGEQLSSAVAKMGARSDTSITRHGTDTDRPVWSRWWPHRSRTLVIDCPVPTRSAREFPRASVRPNGFRRQPSSMILALLLVLALVGAGVVVVQLRTAEQRMAASLINTAAAGCDV